MSNDGDSGTMRSLLQATETSERVRSLRTESVCLSLLPYRPSQIEKSPLSETFDFSRILNKKRLALVSQNCV